MVARPADNHVSLEEALAHFRAIAGGVEVPVNADFEGGFAVEPAGRGGERVARRGDRQSPAFRSRTPPATRPRRCSSSRSRSSGFTRRGEAIDRSGTGVLLTGRSEGFIVGRPDLAETIRRLTAYADAGADCLYAPGIRTPGGDRRRGEAVAPKPVNVLVGSDSTTVAELAAAGRAKDQRGRRAGARGVGRVPRAAREIAEQGTFTALAGGVPFAEINGAFPG